LLKFLKKGPRNDETPGLNYPETEEDPVEVVPRDQLTVCEPPYFMAA
jgi:hypothetical protein